MSYEQNLSQLKAEALAAIAASGDDSRLDEVRVAFLGAKGRLTKIMRSLGSLPPGERPGAGAAANRARQEIAAALEARKASLAEAGPGREALDVTLPPAGRYLGRRHLITRTMEDICAIFAKLGFSIVEGPEVETDYYNFEALNFPADHPARDMQDTLFVGEDLVLRTHTSPVQIRAMEKSRPPVWVIAPGKTYRRDSDITHSPMFHQIEGLAVDKGITFADLKGVLTAFAQACFSPDTKIRLRPSFFPFTEPSAEVDIACVLCGGRGCRLCKGSGWLEILGSGLVDPALYGFVGYNPDEISGFAFGLGIERVAMLKYGLDDIRLLFESDLRFLRQF